MNNTDNKPYGGFPQIYINNIKDKENNKKKREYVSHNTSVSISKILQIKRPTIRRDK